MNVEPTGTTPAVAGAIRQAARVTGADFKYLLATAQVESNFNPNAQAPTSSAKGLFQFIEQTWLSTLKEQGGALGYAPYADAIARQPSGQYSVPDPRMYGRIMELRSDPNANALMAGAYTRANAGKLGERLGRAPSEGELYIAHFMGPNGASRLIEMAHRQPNTPAAGIFPGPARANPQVFYDARGNARGAGEVYRSLVGRYGVARGGPANKAVAGVVPPASNAANTREQRLVGVIKPVARPSVMPEQAAFAGQAEIAAGRERLYGAGVSRPVSQRGFSRGGCARGQRAVVEPGAATGRFRARETPAASGHVQGCADNCAGPGASLDAGFGAAPLGRRARPVPGAAAGCARAVPRPGLGPVRSC